MSLIYLDYNATAPIDPAVGLEMKPFLLESFGNPSSIHSYGIKAKQAIEHARHQVAAMIHAHPDEIVFTSGGTESNNYAIKGIALANIHKGNHIVVSSIEHPSVIEVCRYLETTGFEVTCLPVDADGCVHPETVEKSIKPTTILISVMHANNETGAIQPVSEIGQIARKHGIPFHTDASQSCGKIPIDVDDMQADLLTIAGHKCYAPKGVGALYIRRGIVLEKLIHGADHEQNLRAGTENVASIAGLGKAAELSRQFIRESGGMIQDEGLSSKPTTRVLRDRLLAELLKELPEIKLNGPVDNRLPNTVNISFPGVEANLMLENMKDIAASAGAACHSGSVSASSVLKAMGVAERYAIGTIRFSLGRMTTSEDIDKAVPSIVAAYRKLIHGKSNPGEVSNSIEDIRLTHHTHSLGCACKINPRVLEELLKKIPVQANPNILVDISTSDDAAVYKINDQTAIVQTVDFIPPIVDSPYHYGAIAAANALSDIYAMGGKPLFALNIVAFPINLFPIEVLELILKGASDKVSEAGIQIIGGHTIEDTEPKFGLVVTGTVHPEKILTNAGAKPGDAIILTKPLGTGILSTGAKREMINDANLANLIRTMEQLNNSTAEIMNDFPVSACTDVTGFGLIGHLKEMAKGCGTGANIGVENIPVLPGVTELVIANIVPGGSVRNLQSVEEFTTWSSDIPALNKIILADAQTSGGLLIAVPKAHVNGMLKALHGAGVGEASWIGCFTKSKPHIYIQRKFIFS